MIFHLLIVFAILLSVLGLGIQLLWLVCGRPGSSPLPTGCLAMICLTFGMLVVMWFVGWLNSPTIPSQSDIIGIYEVDRDFCPGPQADWQNKTYQLEITQWEAIVTDARTDKVWRYPISWGYRYQKKYLWWIDDRGSRHHMIQGGPAIVRETFGHYYIFKSPLYGDVVFRKKPTRWFHFIFWGGSLFVIAYLSWNFRALHSTQDSAESVRCEGE